MRNLLFVLIFGVVAALSVAAQTPRLPAEAALVESSSGRATLPEPILKAARTTLVIHVEGELSSGIMFWMNPFTGEPKQIEPAREGNTLTYKFDQYATGQLRVDMFSNGSLVPMANPGETIEAWVDIDAMRAHLKDRNIRYVYYASGDFKEENNALALMSDTGHSNMRNFSYMSHIDRDLFPLASIESFIGGVVSKVERENAAVDTMTWLSGAVREVRKMNNRTMGMRVAASMNTYLQMYQFGRDIFMRNNTDKLGALQKLDMGERKLLYGMDFGYSVPELAIAMNAAGNAPKEGWLSMGGVFNALKKAERRESIGEAEKAAVASVSYTKEPYFGELFAHIQKSVEAQYSGAMESGKFTIRDTPAYDDPSALLEAIAARYPGKMIFIDFWATWCGPCLQAMRVMKPLKPWMAEQGVVSVYITTESSPKTRWTLALPDIGGEHYYISTAEWNAVLAKYGGKTIPYYVILGRDGSTLLNRSGYPGNDQIREILEQGVK